MHNQIKVGKYCFSVKEKDEEYRFMRCCDIPGTENLPGKFKKHCLRNIEFKICKK